jgi:pyridoxal phosphate-dependent aminotransferase EpsN
MNRLFLSPPHLDGNEQDLVADAFASNWIAPLGPHVEGFEQEMAAYCGSGHAAALSSGTAAIHLALRLLGIKRGDEVWCSSFTFAATANPICYEGAIPVFIDSEAQTWGMDPALLAQALDDAARRSALPKAVIIVHLYGQCADLDPIIHACRRHGVYLIEDAAEAVGSRYKGRGAGSLGNVGVLSFNGNKIMTTSGGGMLLSNDPDIISRARFLATQARDPAPHYQHSVIGFNYRLSNVLAAIGRGQLARIEQKVVARRSICNQYQIGLGDIPGITFMPEETFGHSGSRSNRWLTCILIDEKIVGVDREQIRLALERANIEARPLWKPLHLQPVFNDCRMIGGQVCTDLFDHGLCLPSGSAMTAQDVQRVSDVIHDCCLRRS